MGKTRHLGILLRDTLIGVDEDETHVAALDGHGGPQDELLDDDHLDFFRAYRRYQ